MKFPKRNSLISDTLITVGKTRSEYKQNLKIDEGAETHEVKEIIVEKTAAEIIHQINARVKSPYYSSYCAILGVFLVLLSSRVSIALAAFLAFLGVFGCLIVYVDDVKRKTTPLLYRFSDEYSERKFQSGISSFSSLSSTNKAWQLRSKIPIYDWKRNAGSDSGLVRELTKIGKQKPKFIKVNVEVWGIDAGSTKIYLLPDRFLVFDNRIYRAVPYENTDIRLGSLEHVEQGLLPSDAMVIGERWKNIRRDGERDLRFKDNRKLPVVRYSLLKLGLSDITIQILISSYKAAKIFSESFASFLGFSSNPSDDNFIQENELEALSEKGEYSLEHLELLRIAAVKGEALTTRQIAESLGVSSSFVTKNTISFEYEGFRFSRAGRLGRQISWKVEYLRQNI